ncbi:TIGR04063 family PEP-CTERM/XrtA system glycosyltransferase [Rhodocista pekingensis]|uniref:TIGR04063 family PEP-CTERM/XrtA system glycosyltransferase n=1 Tax=Rhodocista pekingensis TaxID=201185 RepID=A0ABW2KYX7_9PROT
MRILHVFDHSLPLQSGYVFRSLGILRAQRALGWQTFHLTTPRQGDRLNAVESADGWDFLRTPVPTGVLARLPVVRYGAEMRATAHRLDALVRELKPDILHAHSPVLNGLPALSVGRRHGIPVVYEVRAFWEDAAVDLGSANDGGLRYRASRWLETRVLHRADAVVALCEGVRTEIVGRGVPSARVTIVPNAVDPGPFAGDRRHDGALAAELGLDGAEVIGFIGSFYHYEGLDLLLRALPAVRARRPRLRLLLVGGGDQEAALRRLAADLGLEGSVVFAGRVPHAAVKRHYDLIDLLVYPRCRMRLTDLVTPLKPLEAMAQGRVVVASDVGGHRELIRDGETGFLFAADDPAALAARLVAVLEAQAAWPAIGTAARRQVERERTWTTVAARYAGVYRAVHPGRPGGAGALPDGLTAAE